MRNNKRRKGLDMQFVTATISIMLVLLLLGLVSFFVLSAGNLSVYVKENINISLVIGNDVRESSILKLQQQVSNEPFVKEAVYVSKKQALREHIAATGMNPEEFLEYNPFMASIELKLKAQYANIDSIARIKEQFAGCKEVVDVKYPRQLLDAVNANVRKISVALLVLAAVFMLISFALINNTIRLAVYSKRFLIHTMKLVGASWGFIRRPFVARNIWSGILAALAADGILMASAYSLVTYEPSLIDIITPGTMLFVSFVVMVLGIALTFFCAYVSVGKYLRMSASALYNI